MKKANIRNLILFCVLINYASLNAQYCDSIANICVKHIISSYISDGQQYRALLLNSEETAQFETVLFEKTTYRIAACSGTNDGNLIFRIKDEKDKILFSNEKYQNAPYWDFNVKSTISVTIEANLDSKNTGSGCAVILIGFK